MSFDPANFFPVLPEQIKAARPHLEPFLTEFEEKTALISPDDVFAQAESGATQLWAYHDGEKFCGVVGTRRFKTSLGEICNLWICCGHDVDDYMDGAFAQIERWARDIGCHALEIQGRKGWGRRLPGFTAKAVVWEKLLAERH